MTNDISVNCAHCQKVHFLTSKASVHTTLGLTKPQKNRGVGRLFIGSGWLYSSTGGTTLRASDRREVLSVPPGWFTMKLLTFRRTYHSGIKLTGTYYVSAKITNTAEY